MSFEKRRYELILYLIICTLIILLGYAISNMINLIKININYDEKIFNYQEIYSEKQKFIEKQNKQLYKIINTLQEKHNQFINKFENKSNKNIDKLNTKELDKYFNSKLIPSVKTIFNKDKFNDNSSYTYKDMYINDDRWSYI